MKDMEDAAQRDMLKVMFHKMLGPSERWGSDISAHMTSLSILARHWSFGRVIELGVGQGFSTIALLSGLGGKPLTSFDINPHMAIMPGAQLQDSPQVEISNWDFHLSDSVEAASQVADGSVSLLFIDTDHRYGPTERELSTWAPKMMKGGVICGHDYYLERMGDVVCGVKQAVDEFAAANQDKYSLLVLPKDQGLFILWPK